MWSSSRSHRRGTPGEPLDDLHSGPVSTGLSPLIAFQRRPGQSVLQELRKYIEFQSTLEVLASPPESYQSAATNILLGLDEIADKDYTSQYEFDLDLNTLINSANDGHFFVSLCSLGIFRFGLEPQSIVSISEDGLEVPEIYFLEDSKSLHSHNQIISPLDRINGQEANEFLGKVAAQRRSQDPDARWNQLFGSNAVLASGDSSGSEGAFINNYNLWPGSNTTRIGFRNGSSIEVPTIAGLIGTTFNATAEDLFETYCLPAPVVEKPSNATQTTPIRPPMESGPVGYPEPFVRDPYNQITGYKLDDETAVMFIPSFEATDLPDNQSAVFADVAEQIVNGAVASGRNKLVIDVSANGGGNIVRAFDLFKLFFPDEFPYSATRFRRSDGTEELVNILGHLNQTAALDDGPFGYQAQVTPDQKSSFASVEDFLGDEEQLAVRVSSLFGNFNYTAVSGNENPIRGYGNETRQLNKTTPFKAGDILIVGDGSCASTCTTFVNLMTIVGGVRTLTFGGRPRLEPMQIMGGVRGAQSLSYSDIESYVANTWDLVKSSGNASEANAILSPEELDRANASIPRPLKSFPLLLPGGNVNFRNAYQAGNGQLPLQFEYQASDCRLFYKYENVIKPATIWTEAKKAVWGGGHCVEGSTGGKGSKEYRGEKADKSHGNDSGRPSGGGAAASRTANKLLGFMLIASVLAAL